uniref:Reverse transcriptase domain-containing protein n=1 Tax=Salmo trutta TaxID=8032 RepID=A0A673WHK7_SALTR
MTDVQIDLFKFFRNLRLHDFFDKSETYMTPLEMSSSVRCINRSTTLINRLTCPTVSQGPAEVPENSERTTFRAKSSFVPPPKRNASIETFCRIVENDVTDLLKDKQKHKSYDNLSRDERMALKDLMSDPSIIIKKCDKGGRICIQKKCDYVNEYRRQLSKGDFYRKLNCDPTLEFQHNISSTVESCLKSGQITKKEVEFLCVKFSKIPTFYTVTKLHKQVSPPPGRPIVAAIDSVTSNISKCMDYHIKPMVENLPSYVKDTSHMISLIEGLGRLPEGTLLATFNVESLYTNIPHTGGLQALQNFLQQRDSTLAPSNDCILQLTELVLSHNYFVFESDSFLQIWGVAIP